ncbi:MAG: chorismate mutase [Fibrobacterales bacterium]
MSTIQNYRDEIDEIEKQLLTILNRRAELAIKIGEIKRVDDIPIFDPIREDEILDRVAGNNPGPLSTESIKEIFLTIITHTRNLEAEHNS